MYRHLRRCVCSLLLYGLPAASITASPAVDEVTVKLRKWVETRQLIGEVRTGWEADKAILEAEARLLEDQIQALEEEVARLENTASRTEARRQELLEQRETLLEQRRAFREALEPLEQAVVKVAARFPRPLAEAIRPLLQVLQPDGREAASPGDRAVSLLGILQQADRFNTKITVRNEVQSLPGVGQRQVETLYWGLSFAFAADASGTLATVGYPGPDGWQFEPLESDADAIRVLLDTAAGDVETIQFTPVHVTLP